MAASDRQKIVLPVEENKPERKEEVIQLKMKLGDHEITWLVYQTRAPQEFDGFGTFAVADFGDEGRLLLIKQEHAAWQRARYQSGMYPCEQPADCDLEAIIAELWARLRTPRG